MSACFYDEPSTAYFVDEPTNTFYVEEPTTSYGNEWYNLGSLEDINPQVLSIVGKE